MTCQECQPLAIDLARGLPPFDVGGAVQRADVLSHVAACKRCAQWLREQEALSQALRAAAEADASSSAPPGVEANVMAAFRARQAQRLKPVPRTVPLPLSLAPLESVADAADPRAKSEQLVRAWRWPAAWRAGRAPAFAFAAAAIIVIAAFTMASVRWLIPTATSPNAGTHRAAGTSTPPSAPAPSPSAAARTGRTAEPAGARITGAGTNAAVVEVLPDKGTKTTKGRPAPPRVPAPHGATARGFDATHEASAGHRETRGASVTRVANTARRGSTTRASSVARGANEFNGPAFVLLPYVEPLRPTEMRHIMRVRMPRTQLTAGGVQASGVDDAVLADVLVGEDGTARAVRIVQ
jgi:hypothetical protein